MKEREFRASADEVSELQNLIDPFAKFRDARVNSGLVGRGAADSPADDPGENPPLVSRSLNDHRTTAVTLKRQQEVVS